MRYNACGILNRHGITRDKCRRKTILALGCAAVTLNPASVILSPAVILSFSKRSVEKYRRRQRDKLRRRVALTFASDLQESRSDLEESVRFGLLNSAQRAPDTLKGFRSKTLGIAANEKFQLRSVVLRDKEVYLKG